MDKQIKKDCFKCGEVKPLSEYYKHKAMGDGHLGKCKLCTKKDTASRIEIKKKTDPEWVFNEKERCRLKSKSNRNTAESNAAYKDRYPEKHKARIAAQGIPKIEGHQNHHWSYNEEHFQDVILLTISNHYKIHRNMIYDPERLMYRTIHGILLDTRESSIEYYSKVLSIQDGVYSELEKLK